MLAELTFSCVLSLLGGQPARPQCDTHYVRSIAHAADSAGREFRVDPKILVAVAYHESRLKQYAIGTFHEIGLMQNKRGGSIQGDWRKLTDRQLSDVGLNIWIGAAYLSKFAHRCKVPVRYLTPFNGGRCVPSNYSRGVLKDLQVAKARSL
jgi:soluble lytic murein transglycosylase-like protein